MARTRSEPVWAMLDWAAQQPGTFRVGDLHRVFLAAGGKAESSSFHTIVGHLTAKDWKEGELDAQGKPYWPPSTGRPFVYARKGHRGKGGAHELQWGLDGPLREPRPLVSPADNQDDDPVSVAIDALEGHMGGPALKSKMQQWRKMGNLRAITSDIRTLPPKLQMNAMLVATQHLMATGAADEGDVEDAERTLSPAARQNAPEAPATPFTPGRPKPNPPRTGFRPGASPAPSASAAATRPAPAAAIRPEVGPEEPDDAFSDDFEDDQGAKTNPDIAPPSFDGPVDGRSPEDGDGRGRRGEPPAPPDEIDTSDYPDWLPPARRDGTKGERGMYRLVGLAQEGGAEISAVDDLWQALANAGDDAEAETAVRELFAGPGYDRRFLPDALAVAREVLSGEDEDGGGEPEGGPEDAGGPRGFEDSDDPEGFADRDDTAEDDASGEWPEWLPDPDPDSGDRAQYSMFRIADEVAPEGEDANAYFEENVLPVFQRIRTARDSLDAHQIIRNSVIPRNLHSSALAVSKWIFEREGRDWETGKKVGGPKREGLRRFFRVTESDGSPVPDPTRRPVPGPTRTLPDYGMDEGPNVDPVDFAEESGLNRIMRLRR